jgi:diadenosine tetraphosphate (Ap4A) HIT family hydrolase
METVPRDYEQDVISDFEFWQLSLHENQSYLGRSIVALKRGSDEDVDPFDDTLEAERAELTVIMSGLKLVLSELYAPTRLNYANLRNQWLHCHWHVIPRYEEPENGLRIVEGIEFFDYNKGRNYAPAPSVELPRAVFNQIRLDIAEGIASVFEL